MRGELCLPAARSSMQAQSGWPHRRSLRGQKSCLDIRVSGERGPTTAVTTSTQATRCKAGAGAPSLGQASWVNPGHRRAVFRQGSSGGPASLHAPLCRLWGATCASCWALAVVSNPCFSSGFGSSSGKGVTRVTCPSRNPPVRGLGVPQKPARSQLLGFGPGFSRVHTIHPGLTRC